VSRSTSITTRSQCTSISRAPTALSAKRQPRGSSGRKSREKLTSLAAEKDLRKRGYRYIIGADEAGRGALAGPVVAASCCILADDIDTGMTPIAGVDDSKALTQTDRERIFAEVMDRPDLYAVHVAEVSNEQIDDTNVLVATMDCFRQAIEELVEREGFDAEDCYAIVDGKKSPKLVNAPGLSCRPWVKADTEVYSVAIAAIVAKVTRDKLMTEAHDAYPLFEFDVNKGYSTRSHVVAIHTHGACLLHRMSFAALKGREVMNKN